MKKRVVAINSSKRKKTTYGLLKQIKKQMEDEDIIVDVFNLFDFNIKECTGCESCLRKGKCYLKDDAESLMAEIAGYDGIIISTPVYMNSISGKLKVFVDRTCRWMHRPELASMPIMFVVTSAASGIKGTIKYLKNISLQWGGFPTDAISRKVKTLLIPVEAGEYNKFVKHLFMHEKKYRPDINQLIQFQVQRVLAEKVLPIDKEYWDAKGWSNQIYFFDARINIVKRSVAAVLYKFLSSRIRAI